MESLKVQAQIRQNSEEISSFLSDLSKWEKKIKSKDQSLQSQQNQTSKDASHVVRKDTIASDDIKLGKSQPGKNATPASIVSCDANSISSTLIPRPRTKLSTKDTEEFEKERGNELFKEGNFVEAVKAYALCIGLKVKAVLAQNYVAFSNRAQAYIKLKEFIRAEVDCTSALAIKVDHCKSYLRRSLARNSIGKHRSALHDLYKAQELEKSNKQIRMDIQKTRELLRYAVGRAPLIAIDAVWLEEEINIECNNHLSGPDLPLSI